MGWSSKCVFLQVSQKPENDYWCEGNWTIVIQARGFIVLRHRDDDRFFKVGGNHRGSEGLIKDLSKLSLVPSEPRPPPRWLHDHRCSVCCFLTRWSTESRCHHYIQSGRRRCLAHRPATDLLSPLGRIYLQRNRWSSVPATCVESHWAENETQFSPCIGV